MTILITESFDGVVSLDDLGYGKWEINSGFLGATSSGRHGSAGEASIVDGLLVQKTFTADKHATMIVGGAYKRNLAHTKLMTFDGDGGTTAHITVMRLSTGAIEVRRGLSGGTVLGTTDADVAPAGSWAYIEVKVVLHDTAGSVVVYADGVNVLNLTGIDTRNGGTDPTIDRIQIFGGYWDDLVILNGAGSVNNDFIGDVTVESILPSGNGTTSNGVGSDGNSTDNYALVGEAGISTTGYVDFATTGDKDTYAFANLTFGSPSKSVAAVAVYAFARKGDTGARSAATIARLGGTEVDGPDVALGNPDTPGAWVSGTYETKPGGGAWTLADVDSAEFGFKARP